MAAGSWKYALYNIHSVSIHFVIGEEGLQIIWRNKDPIMYMKCMANENGLKYSFILSALAANLSN